MRTARVATEDSAAPGGEARATMIPPILCYHKVERRMELGATRLSPRRFAAQIGRLAAAGWRTLSLAELAACVRGDRRPGPREIAITFDDAYRGLRDHAFPVLADHGFGAVCFVITDYAGRLNRWDVAYGGRRFAHLAWRDMLRWQAKGIEFASHTATHPRLTWLDEPAIAREMAASRGAIVRHLGVDHAALSYPFGAAGAREHRIARAEGYELGFALAGRWGGDALSVPRQPVYLWAPPTPAVGMLRTIEWGAAVVANRCAIGTTLWQRLTRPSDLGPDASPDPVPLPD